MSIKENQQRRMSALGIHGLKDYEREGTTFLEENLEEEVFESAFGMVQPRVCITAYDTAQEPVSTRCFWEEGDTWRVQENDPYRDLSNALEGFGGADTANLNVQWARVRRLGQLRSLAHHALDYAQRPIPKYDKHGRKLRGAGLRAAIQHRNEMIAIRRPVYAVLRDQFANAWRSYKAAGGKRRR